MTGQVEALDRQIGVENLQSYLRYRLSDSQDLLKTVEPYAQKVKESSVVGAEEAQKKVTGLQTEVRKVTQLIKSLEEKYAQDAQSDTEKPSSEETTALDEKPLQTLVAPETQSKDLQETISTLESQITTLDLKIAEACESEDFDAADRLQQEMDSATERLEDARTELAKLQ